MKLNVLDYQGVLLPGDSCYSGYFICPCCNNTVRIVFELDVLSNVAPLVFVCKLDIGEDKESNGDNK